MRLRALPMADGTVRPVLEANVVDVAGGAASAYTSLVDAVTGDVLVRRNQVDNATYDNLFTGLGQRDRLRSAARLRAHRRPDPLHQRRRAWHCPPTTSSSRSRGPGDVLLGT